MENCWNKNYLCYFSILFKKFVFQIKILKSKFNYWIFSLSLSDATGLGQTRQKPELDYFFQTQTLNPTFEEKPKKTRILQWNTTKPEGFLWGLKLVIFVENLAFWAYMELGGGSLGVVRPPWDSKIPKRDPPKSSFRNSNHPEVW